MENYEIDYEIYSNGISNELKVFECSVWDRGYYLEIENGIWYKMYVNDTIKSYYPTIEEDFNNIDSISYNFRGYKGL